MTWQDTLALVDFGVLCYIAYLERKAVDLDKANHALYSTYFAERTRWYQARGKRKPSEELSPEVPSNLMVLSTEPDDGERLEDELRGYGSGQQGAGPGDEAEVAEPGERPNS